MVYASWKFIANQERPLEEDWKRSYEESGSIVSMRTGNIEDLGWGMIDRL